MPQTERLLIAVVAVLVLAALVALIKLDIGRNGRPDAPANGTVQERPGY
jgi:hypothetical protein